MGRVEGAQVKRVLLVSPRSPANFWDMRGTVQAVGARSLMPSPALATLVALTPTDLPIQYDYCDEHLDALDPGAQCDLLALTGFSLHGARLAEISAAFRARGIPVALGGPMATADPDGARALCDHLFMGEAEYTWPRFLRDWVAGEARDTYAQDTAVDLKDSPAPDWRFVRGKDHLYMTVQASRGCPNKCDFCAAQLMVGAHHRVKSIDQIMAEIEAVRRAGAEVIFFSEDNFHVRRSFTTALLQRIIEYNTALENPVQFSCQASVRITDDEQILQLLADARFSVVFLGVESLRERCLQEVSKGHLYRADLAERMRRLSSFGLLPFIGMMVGFDNDDEHTFEEIEDFLEQTGSPLCSISILTAPDGTPLYERMAAADRIAAPFSGRWHFSSNIRHPRWSAEELTARHRDLFSRLYEPAAFERRTQRWLDGVSYFPDLYQNRRRSFRSWGKLGHLVRHYTTRAPLPLRRQFFRMLYRTLRADPRLTRKVITVLTQYLHYHSFVSDPDWRTSTRSST